MANGEVRVDIRADTSQFESALVRSGKQVDALDKKVSHSQVAVNEFGQKIGIGGKQTKAFGDTVKKTSSNVQSFGKSAGAAGIQIQQFVGQVQGGVSPMVALSQQAADLGIVLGAPLVGVIAALGASLAMVLIPALFNTSEEMDALTGVADRIREGTKQWNDEIKNFDNSELLVGIGQSDEIINTLQDSMRITQAEIERLGKGGFESLQGGQSIVANLNNRLKDLEQQLAKEEGVRASLQGQIELNNQAREQELNLASRSTIDGLVVALQDQAATLGTTARETALYRLEKEGANVIDKQFVSTKREEINALYDTIEAKEREIDAQRDAERAAQQAIRRAQQQARQAQSQMEANDRLVESLRDRLIVALEEDERKQAILTTTQRLNTMATAEQRAEAEQLAGQLYDVAQAAEAAAFAQQMDVQQSGRIQDVLGQIDTTQMLTAAIGGTKDEMRQAAVAVEEYRLRQELLNQVMQQFGSVSEEAQADIEATVQSYGMAVDELFRVQEAQQAAMDRQEEFQRNAEDFQSTLADGITNVLYSADSAKDALKQMILQISQAIVQAQILKAIQASMGMGGDFGFGSPTGFGSAVASVLQFHEGSESGGKRRNVSASNFINAPKFHDGLRPDEFPAILQTGERVQSREEVRNESRNVGGDVIINVQANDADSFRNSRRQMSREIRSRGLA